MLHSWSLLRQFTDSSEDLGRCFRQILTDPWNLALFCRRTVGGMIYRLEKPSSEHGTPTFPHRVRPISSRRVRAAPICQKATPRKSPRKKKTPLTNRSAWGVESEVQSKRFGKSKEMLPMLQRSRFQTVFVSWISNLIISNLLYLIYIYYYCNIQYDIALYINIYIAFKTCPKKSLTPESCWPCIHISTSSAFLAPMDSLN